MVYTKLDLIDSMQEYFLIITHEAQQTLVVIEQNRKGTEEGYDLEIQNKCVLIY